MTPPTRLHCLSFSMVAKHRNIVILSEHSESKDLRTNWTANVVLMRRSLDSTSFRSG